MMTTSTTQKAIFVALVSRQEQLAAFLAKQPQVCVDCRLHMTEPGRNLCEVCGRKPEPKR